MKRFIIIVGMIASVIYAAEPPGGRSPSVKEIVAFFESKGPSVQALPLARAVAKPALIQNALSKPAATPADPMPAADVPAHVTGIRQIEHRYSTDDHSLNLSLLPIETIDGRVFEQDEIKSFKESIAHIKNTAEFVQFLDQLIILMPELRNIYHGIPVVHEGYSLYTHTVMVHAVFECQLPYYEQFLQPQTIALLRLIIALHDIGKPHAIRERLSQHAATIPLMRTIMQKLNYCERDIEIACALVGHDSIGSTLKFPQKLSKSCAKLKRQYAHSTMSAEEFTAAQFLFYIADSNSYPDVTYYFKVGSSCILPSPDSSLPKDTDSRFVVKQAQRGLLVPENESLYKKLMDAISPGFFEKLYFRGCQ